MGLPLNFYRPVNPKGQALRRRELFFPFLSKG